MKTLNGMLDGFRRGVRVFADLPLWLQATWLIAAVSTFVAIAG